MVPHGLDAPRLEYARVEIYQRPALRPPCGIDRGPNVIRCGRSHPVAPRCMTRHPPALNETCPGSRWLTFWMRNGSKASQSTSMSGSPSGECWREAASLLAVMMSKILPSSVGMRIFFSGLNELGSCRRPMPTLEGVPAQALAARYDGTREVGHIRAP
jgi:hypothetical protein